MEQPTKKFIPTICKPDGQGNEPAYTGYVVMKVPDYDQRNAFFMIEDFDDLINAAAKAKSAGAAGSEIVAEATKSIGARQTIQMMANVKKQLPDWISEINITRKEDGFVFDSFDAVRFDSEVGAITQEMVTELLGKYRVGNPNTPQS